MSLLWLRNEIKPYERRTCVLPYQASVLIEAGHRVIVERSSLRIIPDSKYERSGCELVPAGSWVSADKDFYILGIKELPEADFPLCHRHLYFAHCYKGQRGAEDLLSRFKQGGGMLFDFESLKVMSGTSYFSGYIGAAVAIELYVNKVLNKSLHLNQLYYINQHELLNATKASLAHLSKTPNTVILGYKGNAGRGARQLLSDCGLNPLLWGREETGDPNLLVSLKRYEIILNCIYSEIGGEAFMLEDGLYQDKKLSILTDITCDVSSPAHRFPFYTKTTTLINPCLRVGPASAPVDVIAIDHLPTRLPMEASQALSNQLFPILLNILK